jgi:hypothetical protein
MNRYASSCFGPTSRFGDGVQSIAYLMFRFYSFPHYIEERTFGISCDAFANYKVLPHSFLMIANNVVSGNADQT